MLTLFRYALCGLSALLFSCSIRNPEYTVATVVVPDLYGKGCVIQYYAQGKRHVTIGPRLKHLARGEKFALYYDRLKPFKIELLTEEPLFEPGETTQCAEGKIVKCVNGTWSKVHYSYEVSGKSYKKTQVIAGNYNGSISGKCFIEYWASDPQRSVLLTPGFNLSP